uniref:hypothetical protein n=1 Tax=uncultured Maribacter sp. TaxID=431308 RepID=UPI00262ED00E
GIASTADNGDGTFTLTYDDGTTFTTSDLTGPQGTAGTNGTNGTNGTDGDDGNGIASTADNGDGTFTLTYDDGTTFTTSDLTGPTGAPGATGPAGDPATDDQTLATTGAAGQISITGGNAITLNVNDADSNSSNEIQTLTSNNGSVTLTPSGNDYDLAVNFPASSDNQNIENLAINTSSNVLTVGIEDGNSQTVNLSHLDNSGTDNQSIRNLTFSGNTLTVGIEDGSSDTVSLAALADNQSIQGSGLSGTTLTIGIEDGSSETVNLSSLANTDNQQISLSGDIITLANGTGSNTTVDLSNLSDHDWYEVGGTSAPDNINDNIFTQGNVGIGTTTITNNRALDVEGNLEINDYLYMNGKETLRASDDWLRINTNNSNGFTNGNLFNKYTRIDNRLTINETAGDFDFRVEGTADTHLLFTDALNNEVGIGTNTPDAKLDVEGGTVRFSDYGSNAVSGTPTTLLGVDADGDVVEVNSLKSSKIFYPPSIEVDVATTGTGRTIDLHDEYISQYGTPAVASAGAPAAIPTYINTELYYYVTYFDPTVFANVSVSATGVMTYDVIAAPTDYNTLINVVFVVK